MSTTEEKKIRLTDSSTDSRSGKTGYSKINLTKYLFTALFTQIHRVISALRPRDWEGEGERGAEHDQTLFKATCCPSISQMSTLNHIRGVGHFYCVSFRSWVIK